jgi:SAM-dependent methyltransferase
MNTFVLLFAIRNLKREEIEGKRIIEIGSCDVNGSVRPFVESHRPREYIGTDIKSGSGVDVVCDFKDLVSKFGQESFDIVVSTEMLEHVRDWRNAVHIMKQLCKSGGIIVLSTRSPGFIYHGYPWDFWRFAIKDTEYIFQDCLIKRLETDPAKGVCAKIIKPQSFIEKDLTGYPLCSVVSGKRVVDIKDSDLRSLYFRICVYKGKLGRWLYNLGERIFSYNR